MSLSCTRWCRCRGAGDGVEPAGASQRRAEHPERPDSEQGLLLPAPHRPPGPGQDMDQEQGSYE